MDVQAYGSGGTLIASGCIGSLPDKSCTFDEFLRHISPKWKGSTSVGTSLDPDVTKAATELKSSGYKGDMIQTELFPKAGLSTKQMAPFPTVLQLLGDNINECRKKETDAKLGTLLSKARTCFSMVHAARLADHASELIVGVNNELRVALTKLNKPVFVSRYQNSPVALLSRLSPADVGICYQTAQTSTVHYPTFDWEKIETLRTLQICSSCSQTLHNTIARYIQGFATASNDNKRHVAAIQATQQQETRLSRAPGC